MKWFKFLGLSLYITIMIELGMKVYYYVVIVKSAQISQNC